MLIVLTSCVMVSFANQGMMRSGSTLLEQILDTHGEIFGLGEDSVVNGNLPEFRDKLVRVATSGEDAVQQYLEGSAQRYVEQMLAKVPAERRSRTKHVVDKMLFNYRNVGFIHILYPEAVIIHIVRDPLDCLFSIYRQKFDDHVRSIQLFRHLFLPGMAECLIVVDACAHTGPCVGVESRMHRGRIRCVPAADGALASSAPRQGH